MMSHKNGGQLGFTKFNRLHDNRTFSAQIRLVLGGIILYQIYARIQKMFKKIFKGQRCYLLL